MDTVPVDSKHHEVLIGCLVVALFFLVLISGVTSYSLKKKTDDLTKVTAEFETYKKESHVKIVRVPVAIGDKIAYRTETSRDETVESSKSVTVFVHDVKTEEVRRGGLAIGVNAAFEGISFPPHAEVTLSNEILVLPLLNLPIRAGVSYIQ